MVMDFDFTLLGEVPAPKSFMVRREFRGVGSFKLTVQRDAGGLLARDRVIYRPDRPGQGWIIHRVSRSGDTLTVDGTPLKGLAKRRICLPPLITLLALSAGSLLGGTAVVESVFMWDGVGKLAVDAIEMRDYPMIQAYVMWMALIYVCVNFLADLAGRLLDPRTGIGGGL